MECFKRGTSFIAELPYFYWSRRGPGCHHPRRARRCPRAACRATATRAATSRAGTAASAASTPTPGSTTPATVRSDMPAPNAR